MTANRAIRIAAQRTHALWGLLAVFRREIWLPTNASDSNRRFRPSKVDTCTYAELITQLIAPTILVWACTWGVLISEPQHFLPPANRRLLPHDAGRVVNKWWFCLSSTQEQNPLLLWVECNTIVFAIFVKMNVISAGDKNTVFQKHKLEGKGLGP